MPITIQQVNDSKEAKRLNDGQKEAIHSILEILEGLSVAEAEMALYSAREILRSVQKVAF